MTGPQLPQPSRGAHPPTPAFVVDVETLDQFAERFERALQRHWPNSILSYSFKTNALPWLLAHYRRRGIWAEVVSDSEYELALAVGYTPEQIVYNGPVKSRDRLRSALREGSVVNLDTHREVDWAVELADEGVAVAVGLRVNWDLESYCPGESTVGDEGSRFGFNVASGAFDAALDALRAAGARVVGLHMHRNSRTQPVEAFRAGASIAADLARSRELDLEWLDIGGGFFGSEDGSPTFDDYVLAIRDAVGDAVDPARVRLIVEPGGALVAVPIEFHAGVIDVKTIGERTFVVTDGSRTNIDPLFRRVRPFEVTVERAGAGAGGRALRDEHDAAGPAQSAGPIVEQIVSGFTCMEDDRITRLHDIPPVEVGDRIVFHKVGAYTMSYQSNFIEFLPAVYARRGDALVQVRRKWRAVDYLQDNFWDASTELPAPDNNE